ncbi:unnamed protein product [Caenorhabditis auriculariae]|uniref:Uncharacterized protein n=1 Tax=Caenorhabditis auriculariae TaxID=2777116 RepID=A0A8S1GS79_9PELO|nr:unnamed protein product [Caenorhabditis auriculariae]
MFKPFAMEDENDDSYMSADSRDFSNRMANIFSALDEDTKKESPLQNEGRETKKAAPIFTSTVFYALKSTENPPMKVGLALVNKEAKGVALLYDSSKKVIESIRIEESGLTVHQSTLKCELAADLEAGVDKKNVYELTFIDSPDFIRFVVTVFFLTNSECYVLNEGSGRSIGEGCSVLYDTVEYSIDHNGCLKPPIKQVDQKCKISETSEKTLPMFIRNRMKNSSFLQRLNSSNAILINIKKVKFPIDQKPEALEVSQNIPEVEERTEVTEEASEKKDEEIDTELKARISRIGRNVLPGLSMSSAIPSQEESQTSLTSSHEPSVPRDDDLAVPTKTDKAPEPKPRSTTREDLRCSLLDVHETFHRIIGVEIDRLENRLESRIQQLLAPLQKEVESIKSTQQQILEKMDQLIKQHS